MKASTIRLRRQLRRLVPEGRFETVSVSGYLTRGLVIPRGEGAAFTRLLESGAKGTFCVLYPAIYSGGERRFRPLESAIQPRQLLERPDLKIRLQVMSESGEALGFIEPELFFGFLPDWEDCL